MSVVIFVVILISVPYQCQVHGCENGGTCDFDTGKCSCVGEDDDVHNYNCLHTGGVGGKFTWNNNNNNNNNNKNNDNNNNNNNNRNININNNYNNNNKNNYKNNLL